MKKRCFDRNAPLGATVAFAALIMASPSAAQEVVAPPTPVQATTPEISGDEIVVTARRRDETLIAAPVAVSAVGSAELERRGIVQLDNLVSSVPQLIVSDAGASTQGGVVLIRGIGVGESNPFADQAVSFNVDGVQVGRANVRRLSEVDMVQVEVLKGPQALFFGKNSPAGIIVIRTADPGPGFEIGANASYEFVGDELRLDGFVSTPITDSLGLRVAGYFSDLDGYFRNIATPSDLYGPGNTRLPQNRDHGGRVTLRFDPVGAFDARLKLNYGHVASSGVESSMQVVACPRGFSQLAPSIDDCKADNRSVIADPGPAIEAFAPDFSRVPYLRQSQFLGGLEMNYRFGDTLTLTSITGYYDTRTRFVSSLSVADTTNPAFIFAGSQRFTAEEFSQEVRLASSFDGGFNFLVGGYYQDADLSFSNFVVMNAASPMQIVAKRPVLQDGKAWSMFAQAMIDITPTVELSGGGRYSNERKGYRVFAADGTQLDTASDGNRWTDFSPEVTLAWRPSDDLTVYGAYKTGFLSGGFAVASGDLTLDRSYDQQKARGFEAGVKFRADDGRLTGSFTAYRYDNPGLQVTSNIVHPVFGVDQRIVNAGEATNQGVEFELTYRPIRDLQLTGAVAHNRGRYDSFVTACYAGQSIAMGCALDANAAGVFTNQDLSGGRMVRSPDWTLQGGASYTVRMGGGDTLNLSGDVHYSSGYFAAPSNKPDSWQRAYATLDAGVMYRHQDSGISVGLLGRNLTNRYHFSRAIDATFTGSGAGTNTVTPSDTIASVSRGRQVMLRIGANFR